MTLKNPLPQNLTGFMFEDTITLPWVLLFQTWKPGICIYTQFTEDPSSVRGAG